MGRLENGKKVAVAVLVVMVGKVLRAETVVKVAAQVEIVAATLTTVEVEVVDVTRVITITLIVILLLPRLLMEPLITIAIQDTAFLLLAPLRSIPPLETVHIMKEILSLVVTFDHTIDLQSTIEHHMIACLLVLLIILAMHMFPPVPHHLLPETDMILTTLCLPPCMECHRLFRRPQWITTRLQGATHLLPLPCHLFHPVRPLRPIIIMEVAVNHL